MHFISIPKGLPQGHPPLPLSEHQRPRPGPLSPSYITCDLAGPVKHLEGRPTVGLAAH